MKARIVGPLIFTTVRQGVDAPIIDGCTAMGGDRRFGGLALRIGARSTPARALVIGRVGRPVPNPRRWRWAPGFLVR